MANDARVRAGVLAVDPLRSIGLQAILEEIEGLCPEEVTLEEVFAGQRRLDVLVLDARIAGDGLPDLLLRLRRDAPGLKVVVLGDSLDPARVQSAISSGAKGYLAETAAEPEIRMALEVVLDGSVWAPRKVLARVIEAGGVTGTAQTTAETVIAMMTPREKEVLDLLKDGRNNRDIAAALCIDETTVKAHLGRMLRKTGATNRVELTLKAMDQVE